MAVHNEQNDNTQETGIQKKMDHSGILLMFDALQKHQYSYPVKSTVREVLSNGIDSIMERDTAVKILTGQAKVEDFFVDKEGEVYKDSKFDPSYYDLKCLSTDPNAKITYICGQGAQKDTVLFEDPGVGLGDRRLHGYLSLGFSTKRLSKLPLGKFGLGAKSPLSLGIDFFTIETRHNGRLFRLNVYSYKADPIVPAYNLTTGRENKYIIFHDTNDKGEPIEIKVHYEDTTELNGTRITIPAKKHHKQQYIDAVKSQMLYFPNIQFNLIDENLALQVIEYKANILFEDADIVISDNKYYDKPHILLNKVNYGFINFEELELEDKMGNIAIKMAPEDVAINPSRESIIWNDMTKEMVLTKFNQVVEIATKLVNGELQEPDYIIWLRLCTNLGNRWSNSNSVIGRLGKIVDKEKIKPSYSGFPGLKFDKSDPFPGIRVKYIDRKVQPGKQANHWVPAHGVTRWDGAGFQISRKVYLFKKTDNMSIRKDKYLLTLNTDGVMFLEEPYETIEQMIEAGIAQEWVERVKRYYGKGSERLKMWEIILQSKQVIWYSDVIVPEEFKANETDEDELAKVVEESKEEKEEKEIKVLTHAERRKQDGKTLLYTLYPGLANFTGAGDDDFSRQAYQLQKLEVKISDLNDWDEEVYYANNDGVDMLNLIAMITRATDYKLNTVSHARPHAANITDWTNKKWYRLNHKRYERLEAGYTQEAFQCHYFFDTKVKLIRVARENNKLYRDFMRPERFFLRIENKTITMSSLLIKWNTARLLKGQLDKAKFLSSYGSIDQDIALKYRQLSDYVAKYYREVGAWKDIGFQGLSGDIYQDLVNHLDKVQQFQQFVSTNADNLEGISELAQALFGNSDIQDGMAVDQGMLTLMDEVIDYTNAVGPLLNYIPLFTTPNQNIPHELKDAVLQFLEFRGVNKFVGSTPSLSIGTEGTLEEEETTVPAILPDLNLPF